jgi:hypothetical protein
MPACSQIFLMKIIPLQDEQLPTWAHTTIVFLIVSVFVIPPGWVGASAIVTGHLPPIVEWDGTSWFGNRALDGAPAVIAGCTFISIALSFLTLGVAQLRWAEGRSLIGALPWCFVALTAVFAFWTISLP